MKKIILIIGLVLISFSCKEEVLPESKIITTEELAEYSKLEDVQLVDVRTPEEYSEGYIEGFQNIDFLADDFDEKIKTLDKSKPVIVYCRSGRRSASCQEKMLKAGFTHVYDMGGGIQQWTEEKREVVVPN